jgi:hypothetical protein
VQPPQHAGDDGDERGGNDGGRDEWIPAQALAQRRLRCRDGAAETSVVSPGTTLPSVSRTTASGAR